MRAVVLRPWWVMAWRGWLAVFFAVSTLVIPAGLSGLVALFGAYALLEGATQILVARARYHASQRFVEVGIEGVLGVVLALVALFGASMAPASFTLLIGVWALARGAAGLVEVVLTRRGVNAQWPLPTGLFSFGFGLWLLAFPGDGGMAGALWVGGFAMSGGAVMLARAARVALSGQEEAGLPVILPTASQLLRAVPIRWRTRLRLPAPR